MLTHPILAKHEYLNPVQGDCIELDAKKSPLALLAQTCSQIGSGSSYTSHNDHESSEKLNSCKKLTNISGSKQLSFKPYEVNRKDLKTPELANHLNKTPELAGYLNLQSPPLLRPRSRLSQSDSEKFPSNELLLQNSSLRNSQLRSSTIYSPLISTTPTKSQSLSSITTPVDLLDYYKSLSRLYPLSLGVDSLVPSNLSTVTSKTPNVSNPALSSAFISYIRVSLKSGTEIILPICRDVYCSGCYVNTHAQQVVNGTCPSDCADCIQLAAHTKVLTSLPSSMISNIPSISLSDLSSTTAASEPYVCNWISDDRYCGKRHATSNELLIHLKTHATRLSNPFSTIPPLIPISLFPHSHFPVPATPPRFHPYLKSCPVSSSPSAVKISANLASLPHHPSLSAFYNPYSIYAKLLEKPVDRL